MLCVVSLSRGTDHPTLRAQACAVCFSRGAGCWACEIRNMCDYFATDHRVAWGQPGVAFSRNHKCRRAMQLYQAGSDVMTLDYTCEAVVFLRLRHEMKAQEKTTITTGVTKSKSNINSNSNSDLKGTLYYHVILFGFCRQKRSRSKNFRPLHQLQVNECQVKSDDTDDIYTMAHACFQPASCPVKTFSR